MSNYFLGICLLLFGIIIGNYEGDQATLRDCATKGEAKMVGGGTIRCNVILVIDARKEFEGQ